MNPFIALGLCIFSGQWNYSQYILFPWIGSVAALIFYELIFVRTLEYLDEDNSDDDELKDDRGLELDSDEGEDDKEKPLIRPKSEPDAPRNDSQ